MAAQPNPVLDPMIDSMIVDPIMTEGHEELHPTEWAELTDPKEAVRQGEESAERRASAGSRECFVSGHDFSRAANATESTWALAPAANASSIQSEDTAHSAACEAPSRDDTAGPTQLAIRRSEFLFCVRRAGSPP